MSNLQLVPASQIHVQRSYLQKVEMRVPLYSYGCERKIRKALSHFKGLHSIDVDFYQQKVTVTGLVNRDHVLAAVKAKRKNTRFWSAEDGKQEFYFSGGSRGKIMEDSKRAAATSKKKEHYQTISALVFQQYQTTSYRRAVWSADSEGDMGIGITRNEEVSSVKSISQDARSIGISVCNFFRKAVCAVITYCSKRDSFEKLSGL